MTEHTAHCGNACITPTHKNFKRDHGTTPFPRYDSQQSSDRHVRTIPSSALSASTAMTHTHCPGELASLYIPMAQMTPDDLFMEKGVSYTDINFLTRELLLKHLEEESPLQLWGPNFKLSRWTHPQHVLRLGAMPSISLLLLQDKSEGILRTHVQSEDGGVCVIDLLNVL